MRNFAKTLLIAFTAAALMGAGRIQDSDVKSLAEVGGAGNVSRLINTSKIYDVANAQQLSASIAGGVLGGGSGGGNGKNYLSNSSFDSGALATNWTVTTASSSLDTTNFTDGTQSAFLSFAGTTGSIVQDVTPTTQLQGVNLEATCFVKTAVSGVQVCGRLSGSNSSCVSVPNTGTWSQVTANFVGASSGSIGVSVNAVSAITGSVNVDQCYVGKAQNIGSVAQAEFIGSVKWAPTTSCSWDSGLTTFGNFSNVSACATNARTVIGAVTDSSAGVRPEISVTNPKPGRYLIKAVSSFYKNNTANSTCLFTVSDGTNSAQPGVVGTNGGESQVPLYQGELSYTAAPTSPLVLNFQARSPGSNTCSIYAQTPGLEISVYRFPSIGEIAVRANQSDYPWQSDTLLSGLTANAVWNGFGTLTENEPFTTRKGDSIWIRATIRSGTVTATTSKIILPTAYTMDLTKLGTNQKKLGECTDLVNSNTNTGSGNIKVDAFYNGSDASGIYLTQNVVSQNYTTRNTNDYVNSTDRFTCLLGPIPISGWSGTQSAPLLVGSITSGSSGARRLESVKFAGNTAGTTSCTSSPCTISQVSSSWVTNVTRTGTGTYQINIPSGIFSAEPTCACGHGQGGNAACYVQPGSATLVPILSNNFSTGVDTMMNVICEGPR